MTQHFVEQGDLITLDRQIDALNQRMRCLKERMATMASQQYETKNQSILLATMQEVLKDLHLLRLELLGAQSVRDDDPEGCYRADAPRDMILAARWQEERHGAR